MITLDADFSTTVRGGMVRAWPRPDGGHLKVGETVLAVEEDEELEFEAIVVDVAEDGSAYLEVLWRDAEPEATPATQNVAVWNVAALRAFARERNFAVTVFDPSTLSSGTQDRNGTGEQHFELARSA